MSQHSCKYEWEPCHYPPAPGRAYCGPHLTPPHPHGVGHGQPCDTFTVETQQHIDHGYIALQCDICEATWVGPIYEACTQCETSLEHMRQWQAELVLTPPDTDPDDIRRPEAITAWQQRLTTAIQAGIITKHDASRAWKRIIS